MVVAWPWEHNQQSVIYIPKSLILILIERLSLSTMSGCYTGRASWCDKSKRAREKGKGVRKRRKKMYKGRENVDSQKRKAISSEKNSDFVNGLDFGNEEQLEDEFSEENIKEHNV